MRLQQRGLDAEALRNAIGNLEIIEAYARLANEREHEHEHEQEEHEHGHRREQEPSQQETDAVNAAAMQHSDPQEPRPPDPPGDASRAQTIDSNSSEPH